MNSKTKDIEIKSKGAGYLLLTLIMLITSALSILFISHYFSDKNLFLSLDFLTLPVLIKLCALLIIYFLLDALRFFYILKTLKINISFPYMIKLAFINIFISNITPFATGGGFAQIYFLNKKNVPLGGATAASTIRTLLPILFFFITTPFILIKDRTLISLFPENHTYFYIGVLVLLYGFIIYVFIKLMNNLKIVKGFVYKLLMALRNKKILSPKRSRKVCLALFREMEGFTSGFQLFLKGGKRHIILSVAFTLLFLLSLFLIPVLLIYAMGYHISVMAIIEMQVIITFITYFAFTPGASGIAEGGFALIFSNIISKGDIVSLTLSWRFFTIYIGVIIGLVIFYLELFRTSYRVKVRK